MAATVLTTGDWHHEAKVRSEMEELVAAWLERKGLDADKVLGRSRTRVVEKAKPGIESAPPATAPVVEAPPIEVRHVITRPVYPRELPGEPAPRPSHCRKGHALTDENTRRQVFISPIRQCRRDRFICKTCETIASREREQRNRELLKARRSA